MHSAAMLWLANRTSGLTTTNITGMVPLADVEIDAHSIIRLFIELNNLIEFNLQIHEVYVHCY